MVLLNLNTLKECPEYNWNEAQEKAETKDINYTHTYTYIYTQSGIKKNEYVNSSKIQGSGWYPAKWQNLFDYIN